MTLPTPEGDGHRPHGIYARLIRQLGGQKIDILIKDANAQQAAVFDIAQQTGIRL